MEPTPSVDYARVSYAGFVYLDDDFANSHRLKEHFIDRLREESGDMILGGYAKLLSCEELSKSLRFKFLECREGHLYLVSMQAKDRMAEQEICADYVFFKEQVFLWNPLTMVRLACVRERAFDDENYRFGTLQQSIFLSGLFRMSVRVLVEGVPVMIIPFFCNGIPRWTLYRPHFNATNPAFVTSMALRCLSRVIDFDLLEEMALHSTFIEARIVSPTMRVHTGRTDPTVPVGLIVTRMYDSTEEWDLGDMAEFCQIRGLVHAPAYSVIDALEGGLNEVALQIFRNRDFMCCEEFGAICAGLRVAGVGEWHPCPEFMRIFCAASKGFLVTASNERQSICAKVRIASMEWKRRFADRMEAHCQGSRCRASADVLNKIVQFGKGYCVSPEGSDSFTVLGKCMTMLRIENPGVHSFSQAARMVEGFAPLDIAAFARRFDEGISMAKRDEVDIGIVIGPTGCGRNSFCLDVSEHFNGKITHFSSNEFAGEHTFWLKAERKDATVGCLVASILQGRPVVMDTNGGPFCHKDGVNLKRMIQIAFPAVHFNVMALIMKDSGSGFQRIGSLHFYNVDKHIEQSFSVCDDEYVKHNARSMGMSPSSLKTRIRKGKDMALKLVGECDEFLEVCAPFAHPHEAFRGVPGLDVLRYFMKQRVELALSAFVKQIRVFLVPVWEDKSVSGAGHLTWMFYENGVFLSRAAYDRICSEIPEYVVGVPVTLDCRFADLGQRTQVRIMLVPELMKTCPKAHVAVDTGVLKTRTLGDIAEKLNAFVLDEHAGDAFSMTAGCLHPSTHKVENVELGFRREDLDWGLTVRLKRVAVGLLPF